MSFVRSIQDLNSIQVGDRIDAQLNPERTRSSTGTVSFIVSSLGQVVQGYQPDRHTALNDFQIPDQYAYSRKLTLRCLTPFEIQAKSQVREFTGSFNSGSNVTVWVGLNTNTGESHIYADTDGRLGTPMIGTSFTVTHEKQLTNWNYLTTNSTINVGNTLRLTFDRVPDDLEATEDNSSVFKLVGFEPRLGYFIGEYASKRLLVVGFSIKNGVINIYINGSQVHPQSITYA